MRCPSCVSEDPSCLLEQGVLNERNRLFVPVDGFLIPKQQLFIQPEENPWDQNAKRGAPARRMR